MPFSFSFDAKIWAVSASNVIWPCWPLTPFFVVNHWTSWAWSATPPKSDQSPQRMATRLASFSRSNKSDWATTTTAPPSDCCWLLVAVSSPVLLVGLSIWRRRKSTTSIWSWNGFHWFLKCYFMFVRNAVVNKFFAIKQNYYIFLHENRY